MKSRFASFSLKSKLTSSSSTYFMRHQGERGNVFFTLFGAVAVVGVLGAGIMSTMRGPLSTMVEVNRREQAKADIRVATNLVLVNSNDEFVEITCEGGTATIDEDGFTEGVQPDSGAGPTGGGLLPAIGSAQNDPWGNPYGYCAWDHGPFAADYDGACARYLAGNSSTGNIAIAVISAGPDGDFDTSCVADNGGSNDYVEPDGGGGDDIVEAMTYNQAVSGSGGLWSLIDSDTAEISYDLEVDGGAEFAGDVDLSAGTGALRLGAASLVLPDQTVLGDADCNSANDGLIRINTTGVYGVEVCQDGTGWVPAGSVWTGGAGDDIFYNTGTPQIGIGTASPDDTLDVVGTAQITGGTVLGSTLSVGGAATLSTTLDVTGATALGDTLSVDGNTIITGDDADNSSDALVVNNSAASSVFVVQNNGMVGINDADPTQELDVDGDVTVSGTYMLDGTTILGNDNVATNILLGDVASPVPGTTANYLNLGDAVHADLLNKRVGVGFADTYDAALFDDALEVNGNADIDGNLELSGGLVTGDNTSGNILVADGTSFESVSMSGDVNISGTGAATIQDDAVTTAKINNSAVTTDKLDDDAVTDSKISAAGSAGCLKLSGSTMTWAVCGSGTGASGVPTLDQVLDEDNDADGNLIRDLSDPIAAQDAATKAYVDAAAGSGVSRIVDADGDTQVQVEEGADDDMIRFDTAGVERMVIDAGGKVLIGSAAAINESPVLLEIQGGDNSPASASIDAFGSAMSDSSLLVLQRANGTQVSPAGLLAGNRIGAINWRGYDGGSYDVSVGEISVFAAEDFTGVNNRATNMRFYTRGTSSASRVERMRINRLGHVGIGTSSPDAALEVAGTDSILFPRGVVADRPSVPVNGMMRYNTDTDKYEAYQAGAWQDIITSGAGGVTALVDADNDTKIQVEESADDDTIRFDTAGAERMVINADGSLSIASDISLDDESLDYITVTTNVTPTTSSLLTASQSADALVVLHRGYMNEDAANGHNASLRGGVFNTQWDHNDTGVDGGAVSGLVSLAAHNGSGNLTSVNGIRGIASLNTTGAIDQATGIFAQATTTAGGTINSAWASRNRTVASNGGVINTAFGMQSIVQAETGGTIINGEAIRANCNDADTCYGLRVVAGDPEVPAGQDWGIYSTGEDQNYLSGGLSIGSTVLSSGAQDLELDVTGDVGAANYCDENGNNCFTAASVGGTSLVLADADNDTKIQVEESADEDIIRFDTAGVERMTITDSGTINMQANRISAVGDITFDNDAIVIDSPSYGSLSVSGSGGGTHQIFLVDDRDTSNNLLSIFDETVADQLILTGNSSFNGDLAVDTDTLFVDAANDRVGIGGGTPLTNLDVRGGLGTNPLHIYPDGANNDEKTVGIFMSSGINQPTGSAIWNFREDVNNNELVFATSSVGASPAERMRIDNIGNVGIGTSDPAAALEVGGTNSILFPRGTTAEQPSSPVNGMMRYNSDNDNFEVYQAGAWESLSTDGAGTALELADADNDTKIQVEKNADEDVIRFDTAGIERMRISAVGGILMGATSNATTLNVNGIGVFTHATAQIGNISPSIVVNRSSSGDMVDGFGSSIRFDIQDDSAAVNSIARISAVRSGSDALGSLVFSTGAVGSEVRMTIDEAGGVGIGTEDPAAALEVAGTDSILFPRGVVADRPSVPVNGMMRYNSDNDNFEVYQAGAWTSLSTDGAGTALTLADADGDTKVQVEEGADEDIIRFDTAGVERMVIDADGDVGIGTSNPVHNLTIFNEASSNISIATRGDDASEQVGVSLMSLGNGASTFNSVATKGWRISVPGDAWGSGRANDLSINYWSGGVSVHQNTFDDETGFFGLNTQSPQAALDVAGTDSILFPRGTTAEQPSSPVNGMMRYNSDNDNFEVYQAGAWESLSTDGAGTALTLADADGDTQIQVEEGADEDTIRFDTAGTQRMKIMQDGRVGIGTDTINNAVILSIDSSTRGVLLPRMLTSARDSIGGGVPPAGTLIYNLGTATFDYYEGAVEGWVSISTDGTGTALEIADADNDTKIQVEDSADEDIIRFDTAGVERMVIDPDGNVGIGTTSPSSTLDIVGEVNVGGTGDAKIILDGLDTGSVSGDISIFETGNDLSFDSRGGFRFYADNNNNTSTGIAFSVGGDASPQNLLSLREDARLGIGTDSPEATLDVVGTDSILFPRGTTAEQPSSPVNGMMRYNSDNGKFEAYQAGAWGDIITAGATTSIIADADDDTKIQVEESADDDTIRFDTAGVERMAIDADGKVGVGMTSPETIMGINAGVPGSSNVDVFSILRTPTYGQSLVFSEGSSGHIINGYSRSTNSKGIIINATTDDVNTADTSGTPPFISLNTMGQGRLRIDENGDVGIGTSTIAAKLDVRYDIDNSSDTSFRNSSIIQAANNDTTAGSSAFIRSEVAQDGYHFGTIFNTNDDVDFVINRELTSQSNDSNRFTIKNNGNVGIGTYTPDATLDVAGTNSVLFPRGTTAEQPSSPVNGMMRYNSDNDNFEVYQAGAWESLSTDGASSALADADGDTQIQVEESADEDIIRFDTAGAERMVIDDNGVIIGHDRGSFSFQKGVPDFLITDSERCKSDGISGVDPLGYCSGQSRAIVHNSSDVLALNFAGDFQGGTNIQGGALVVDSDENVGIGVDNPNSLLHVNGRAFFNTTNNSDPLIVGREGASISDEHLRMGVTDTIAHIRYLNDEANSKLVFTLENLDTESGGGANANTTEVMTLTADENSAEVEVDGNVKADAFLTTSDRRLKKDIEDIDGLALLSAIDAKSFRYIKDDRKAYGVIAQDVESVMPEAVFTNEETGYKTVDYAQLTPALIDAVKVLERKVQLAEGGVSVSSFDNDNKFVMGLLLLIIALQGIALVVVTNRKNRA